MAVIMEDFKEPVVGPDGVACRARATNGAPTFWSPYETEQSSNYELRQWADSLTRRYLEDALTRAIRRLCPPSR